MSRLKVRSILMVFVTVAWFASASDVLASDPVPRHKVWLDGTEEKGTFSALVDGQLFTTIPSLEDYLVTLPVGDEIFCRCDGGKLFIENPDLPQLRHYLRILKEFCDKHYLRYFSAISFL